MLDKEALKFAGLKVTRPRSRVLEILETAGHKHLSAEDVYRCLLEEGDDISLATIYRVLAQFESAGIVERHYFDSGTAVFEAMPETHHDHLVCVRCGRVVEFLDPLIEERQREVARKKGYKMQDHSLVIYGICDDPACRSS